MGMDHRRRRAGAAFGAAALLLVLASGCTSHDSTPVRAAGYVSLTDAVPMTADGSAAQARLVGPHFDLEFTKIEATTENLAPAFRAAPGHEILLLHGDTTQQRPAYNAGSGDSVTASVVVDGATRPLQYLPAYGLAVSVPQGHTATLQVTDDGRTQSLDVRTGKRGKDAIAGYYRPHELKWTDADYHDTGRATCTGPRGTTHFTTDMSTTFGQAAGSLEPWLPGAGWAKDGRVWLHLSTVSM